MIGPSNSAVLKALIGDTFRQSLAARIFWLMLTVSVICILLCLSVQIDGDATLQRPGERTDFLPSRDKDVAKAEKSGVDVVSGKLTVAFGAIAVPLGRDRHHAVYFVELLLAGLVADTVGILLTLVWTAAFLPAFLEPGSVAVVLAKPVSRRQLLFGKYLGVLCFVAVQSLLFVGGTYIALALRTGILDATYLWCIPLLLVHFAIFYGFSVMLAVVSRSTIVCILGSLLFWFLCWGMNFGRHTIAVASLATPESTYSPALLWLIEVCYWILPKPADVSMLLFDALGAQDFFAGMPVFDAVRKQGSFHPAWSIAASLAFSAVTLLAATQQFDATDY